MPRILDLDTIPEGNLGVWKITEDPEDLKSRLQWSEEDTRRFQSHTDGERSKHWLYSRVLLREMLNTSSFIELGADEFGKPFLANFPQKLSISHSGEMVAVMLSQFDCGMDIQLMKPNIERVAHKFISDAEWQFIHPDTRFEQMYLVWCCKEALYKYYGKKNLAFKEHLALMSFKWSPEGMVQGIIKKDGYYKELPVYWKTIDDYMVAWVSG